MMKIHTRTLFVKMSAILPINELVGQGHTCQPKRVKSLDGAPISPWTPQIFFLARSYSVFLVKNMYTLYNKYGCFIRVYHSDYPGIPGQLK